MSTAAEVRARRLTAVLQEAVGGGCPPDLAARVLARVRAVPPRKHSASLLAALCMLAGIAVVVATARGVGRAAAVAGTQEPAPQDPAPKEPAPFTVTTAMVQAAIVAVDAPPPGDGVARLLALASRGPASIVVAPGVRGESKAALEGLTWHEAVVHIADELGVGVAEYGSVVVVGIGARRPLAQLRCTIPAELPRLHVADVPRVLHRLGGLDCVVPASAAGQVAFDVRDVPVRTLLDVVAARSSLQVVGCGSVLALRPVAVPPAPLRLALNLRNRSIGDVLATWAKLAGRNVVIDAAVQGVVSVRTLTPHEPDLLQALAAAVGAEVVPEDRGILRFVPRLAAPPVTWTTNARGDAETAAEVAARSGLPEGLLAAPGRPAKSVVVVAQAAAADVLQALALATGQQLRRREGAYVIE